MIIPPMGDYARRPNWLPLLLTDGEPTADPHLAERPILIRAVESCVTSLPGAVPVPTANAIVLANAVVVSVTQPVRKIRHVAPTPLVTHCARTRADHWNSSLLENPDAAVFSAAATPTTSVAAPGDAPNL